MSPAECAENAEKERKDGLKMSSRNSNDFLEKLAEKFAESLSNNNAIRLAEENGSLDSYYLQTWSDNVWGGTMPSDFQRMYNEGDGRELLCKACAIHSSSMLAYNFFHWINNKAIFRFHEIEFDQVVFEVKIPCLKKLGAAKKKTDEKTENSYVCANMDVMLVGKQNGQPHVFFLESKFTEHFSSASSAMRKINSAYYDKNKVRYIVTKYDMPAVVEEFRDKALVNAGRKVYYDGIKQSICHLIAMTNLVDDKNIREVFARKYKIDEASTFHFANLLYEPAEKFKEFSYYQEYCKLYEEFYMSVAGKYPEELKVEPKPLSYMDVWSVMKEQVNQFCPGLREYLEARYMNLALTNSDSGSNS